MKKTLLFVLALTAVGCAEGEQEESASCAALSIESPLEDVLLCAEQGDARAQYNLGLTAMSSSNLACCLGARWRATFACRSR